jgi:ORF6N domain
MSKPIAITQANIVSKIYVIRGHKVMLDYDLSELYQVETKQLKRQVRRNLERFPTEFMFELTQEEYAELRSQNGTSSWGGTRYVPFAFTEHGVLMLSSVLNSAMAIQTNIAIIKIFTQLRESIASNSDTLLKLEKIDRRITNLAFDVKTHDGEIETIFELINEIRETKSKPTKVTQVLGFTGHLATKEKKNIVKADSATKANTKGK